MLKELQKKLGNPFPKKKIFHCKENKRMPLPLLPQQEFYIAHRVLPADYAMPALEAATDHYGMGYIISGDRFTITPKHSYYHCKGELGMMPPYLYHKTMPLAPEAGIPYEGILVKFSPKFVEPFIACVGQSVFDKIFSYRVSKFLPEDSEKILAHLMKMLEIYEGDFSQKNALLQYMLYELLLTALRLRLDNDGAIAHNATLTPPILDAIFYMEQNYSKNPSLEETAAVAGYSPAYFSKLFHAQLGKSYSDYFAVIKLKHVQHLLLSTDKSITEIALDTGYRHVSNLSEQFKKLTGMSPLQYRRLK